MSDPVILGAVTVFFTSATTAVTLYMIYLMAKLKDAAIAAEVAVRVAAQKVEQVKDTLAHSQKATDTKLDTIHGLVNSALGVQLKLNATVSRRLAIAQPTEENLADAVKAERVYADHETSQAREDARVRGAT